jgi:hypothetical protein
MEESSHEGIAHIALQHEYDYTFDIMLFEIFAHPTW